MWMADDLSTRSSSSIAALGLGNTEIARRLVLSEKTIRNNFATVLTKLQVHDRAAAVAMDRTLAWDDLLSRNSPAGAPSNLRHCLSPSSTCAQGIAAAIGAMAISSCASLLLFFLSVGAPLGRLCCVLGSQVWEGKWDLGRMLRSRGDVRHQGKTRSPTTTTAAHGPTHPAAQPAQEPHRKGRSWTWVWAQLPRRS